VFAETSKLKHLYHSANFPPQNQRLPKGQECGKKRYK